MTFKYNSLSQLGYTTLIQQKSRAAPVYLRDGRPYATKYNTELKQCRISVVPSDSSESQGAMAKIVKVDIPSQIERNNVVGVGLSSWVLRVDAVAKCYTRPTEREREISVYQRLGSHKSILKYYGSLNGSVLLQFAPHGTIREYLESYNPPLATRLMWTEQATEAISYLHSNGIFHCDISYNNIFLDASYNAMVADFAGSSIDDQEALGFYATSHHHPDIEDPSTESEIFALGSTFYEILTGENPFNGCEATEMEKNIRDGNFPTLEHLPALQKIISKCWKCGYQTVDELLLEVKKDGMAL